jgi:hypothetical protein
MPASCISLHRAVQPARDLSLAGSHQPILSAARTLFSSIVSLAKTLCISAQDIFSSCATGEVHF